jgi:hypothetical protein
LGNGYIIPRYALKGQHIENEYVATSGRRINGLTRLKKGDEATLVIHFAISRDAAPDLGLPPYSTLVYRLEIVDLK